MSEEDRRPTPTGEVSPRWGIIRDRFGPAPEVVAVRRADAVCPVRTALDYPATLVTRYADTRTLLGDPGFGFGALPPAPALATGPGRPRRSREPGFLLALDAPDHTRLRRMLQGRFTVRMMRSLEPRVAAIVDAQLDRMVAAGPPSDLVANFALPVSSLVICELLGVPYADRDEFQARAERFWDAKIPPAERRELARSMRAYMAELVAASRQDPGDGIIGALITEHGARPADEGGIDDVELVGLANLLLTAGHETTANTIALGALALFEDPAQLDLLRAALVDPDPAPLTRAVEEILRYTSVVSESFARIATDDAVVGSHHLPAGTVVVASLGAANRDPALGDDLDTLDLTRSVVPHVAFGHGAHHCLGAPLARMELRIAFRALLERLPALAPAVDPAEVEFRSETLIYGLRALPVTW